MRSRPHLGALLTVLISLASACGDGAADEPALRSDAGAADASDAACPSDGGCQIDADCRSADCPPTIDAATTIALAVRPPAFRDGLSASFTADVSVFTGTPLPDQRLSAPIVVRGAVLFNAIASDAGTPVAASLRFSSTAPVSGVIPSVTANSGQDGLFELSLGPGTYDVWIEPERADVARTVVRGVELNSPDEFRAFSLIAPEQYVVVSGVLERQQDLLVPVSGARVQAIGDPGRVETTADVTDDEGRFVIFAPPIEGEYVFQVKPEAGVTDVPTASFAPVSLQIGQAFGDLHLQLGPWTPPVPTRFQLVDPGGSPVPNTVVAIRTEVAAATAVGVALPVTGGRFDVRIPAELIASDGTFSVELPPGRVHVYAAPLDADYGLGVPVLVEVAPLEPTGERGLDPDPVATVQVVVEQRHAVAGRVALSSGEGVADVAVEARMVSSELLPIERYPAPANLFEASTTTGSDGSFAFRLPPGDWEIELIPPPDSSLARRRDRQTIGRGSESDLQFTLVPGIEATGRVIDSTGAAVGGATVTAYDSDGRPVAEDVTDDGGVYRLSLPRDR